uniref:Uncharacterized protein n=1 Tax=Arundo donax TaxID=35708 RepID=A0A0A9G8Y3_ARUDO
MVYSLLLYRVMYHQYKYTTISSRYFLTSINMAGQG